MPLLFANPLGFLALFGIPVVLLIHFLQRESRRLPVSTLFLLDHLDRQSVKGNRFDRLRQSLPLWLQLLGVLILTWLLVEPRWTNAKAVQRVAIVLDSSASMEAFRKELELSLREKVPPLSSAVGTTEYTLIPSTVTGENLYRGTSFEEMMTALRKWSPSAGSHPVEQALRVGRSLAGVEGVLIFATDHPLNTLPFGAALLSVGSPIENAGFAGLRVETDGEETVWRATLRNYTNEPLTRHWVLTAGNRKTEPRSVDLAPGEVRTLQGKFPEAADRLSLLLEPDRFRLDDQIFVVRPSPKLLLISRTGAPNIEPVVAGLTNSLENVKQSAPGETPDLVFATYSPLQPSELPPVAIVFLNQEQVPRQFFSGPIVTANDPIVEGLDWQGLIARSTPSIPLIENEKVLLWQGDRALILLREQGAASQLVFNFDVVHANASRLPAFAILIHRFVQRIREGKVGTEVANSELRQPLFVAHDASPGAPPLLLTMDSGRVNIPINPSGQFQAPGAPEFFQVMQGQNLLLDSSANFADTREANFSKAAVISEVDSLPIEISKRQSTADPAWRIWIGITGASLLLCWYSLGRSAPDDGTTHFSRKSEL